MESNYNNRDFEQFVKQNADQYRMFPSDKVWAGIDKALHTRRRWYGLGLALLLVMTGAGVTFVMLSSPNKNQQQATGTISTIPTEKKTTTISIAELIKKNNNGPIVFAAPDQPVAERTERAVPFIADIPFIVAQTGNTLPEELLEKSSGTVRTTTSAIQQKSITANYPVIERNTIVPAELLTASTDMDNLVSESIERKEPGQTQDKAALPNNRNDAPLTIESVVNAYTRAIPRKKAAWQVYFAPTISYRKLSENKYFLQNAANNGSIPVFAAYNDVKNVVTHKPAIGLELGVAVKYPLGKLLSLKAGLQFNASRYDIKAFTNPGEIATIALDAGAGSNSISRETTYRTRTGSSANWLKNLYYSASIPVGAELKIAGDKTGKGSYVGIAATAQPTYIISDRAYLLSTDFKNYVEVPSLIRRWNLNTSFETFVSYSTGTVRWQIGPQIRYQTRSSFENKYPFKENLFDFGLKVGLTFNQ